MLTQAAIFVITVTLICGDTIYEAPSFDVSDQVQFFYLESSFPSNVPPNIKNAAGSSFINYGVSHAGLGVWDTTTDVKFSIEFLSNDYVGGLLPTVTDGQINWLNAGSVVITNPLVESNWLNSRLVSTTTSSSWSQMVTYLQDNSNLFVNYQPVTILYANASLVSNTTVITTDDIDSIGSIIVPATNSFAFVDAMISQLASYGCDLGAFLQIYATSYDYLAKEDAPCETVEWPTGGSNLQVSEWYANLRNCYMTVYQTTEANGGGAAYFQDAIKSCYGDVAYVYQSATSVYNVTLADPTASYATPELSQYVYNLPPANDGDLEQLSVLDYFMMAFFFIFVVFGVLYFVRKFFGKKERRNVSFEGERAATRTVNNLVGADEMDDHEEKAYYHGKKRSHTLFTSWSAGRNNRSATQSSAAIDKRANYQEEDSSPRKYSPRADSERDSNSLERPLTSAEY